MSTDVRQRLNDQQVRLVAALTNDAAAPAGFDVARLSLAAAALRSKRLRAVVRAWPELAALDSAATEFSCATLLAQYFAAVHLPKQGGPLADGRMFVRWLATRRSVPDALRLRAMSVDLHYKTTAYGLVRRRFPCLQFCWLRESRTIVLAVQAGRLGQRSIQFNTRWRPRHLAHRAQ